MSEIVILEVRGQLRRADGAPDDEPYCRMAGGFAFSSADLNGCPAGQSDEMIAAAILDQALAAMARDALPKLKACIRHWREGREPPFELDAE